MNNPVKKNRFIVLLYNKKMVIVKKVDFVLLLLYPMIKTILFLFSFFTLLLFVFAVPTQADVTFDLIAPQGTLKRGNTARFQINIDTGSTPVTSSQVGMTYDTKYLQFQSVAAGNAMTSLSVKPTETGKFLISGTNNAGFKGLGVFGYADFKISADVPGSTQVCTLWGPSSSPAPTASPTIPPAPTQLPKSGVSSHLETFGLIGLSLFFIALVARIFLKNSPHSSHDSKTRL